MQSHFFILEYRGMRTMFNFSFSYDTERQLAKRSKTLRQSFIAVITLACVAMLSTEALAKTSKGKNTLYQGRFNSPVWTSSQFNGNMYRDFRGGYLQAKVNHSKGGWDTAIQGNYAISNVDKVKGNYWVASKYHVSGSGSGLWWMGPKVSVNWQNGNPNGSKGWYENYIVDRAKQKPWEIDKWLKDQGAKYLGSSKPSGIHYKYYRRPFSNWVQYRAVRQYDPGNQKVWTPVKHILQKWRGYGLPNKRVDSIRLNVETHKANYRTFTFKDISVPTSFN